MSFLQVYAKEKKFPQYFVVLMQRMGFDSAYQFATIDSQKRNKILDEFTVQIMNIAADRKDSFHKIVKDHVLTTIECFKYLKYVRPIAVEILFDGKLIKN